ARLEPARKLVLGLRPEHLSRANGGGQPQLPARVEVVEPTGAETIVILKLGDHEVTARFDPDTAPAEGETIDLAVAVNKACLFDPETGVRL
ncbi:MAG: TOBE domain-containing protein, partial [Rhizobiales bacterium]|nr:TOBE domain-containing protein [Hyphomicrobiales bacterium]